MSVDLLVATFLIGGAEFSLNQKKKMTSRRKILHHLVAFLAMMYLTFGLSANTLLRGMLLIMSLMFLGVSFIDYLKTRKEEQSLCKKF
ncbi:hypothetical protein ABQD61_03660 [Enterococcus asini]|uniref:hypothetical protein n=1 Tax=Enterococcus asini TaxID=57732 RepID=UPI0032E5316A